MTGSYIAAHDGTERGADAVALARTLARRHGAPVRMVHVCPPVAPWIRRVGLDEDPTRAERARALALEERLRTPGDPLVLTITAGSPAHGLHEVAERERAELIVVASPRRGPQGRTSTGSTAQRLLHGAPCAVAVAPAGYASRSSTEVRVLAVAVDDGRESQEALRRAIDLAWRLRASLLILTAVDVGAESRAVGVVEVWEDVRHAARVDAEQLLRDARRAVPHGIAVDTRVCFGEPGRAIVDACEEGVDLLVCGSRGYGPLRVVLLGSVSSYVVTHALCPVLVVPRGAVDHERRTHGQPAAAGMTASSMGGPR